MALMLTVWVLYRDLEISGRTKAAGQKSHLSREKKNGQGITAGSSSVQSLQCRSIPGTMDIPVQCSPSPLQQTTLFLNSCFCHCFSQQQQPQQAISKYFHVTFCFCPNSGKLLGTERMEGCFFQSHTSQYHPLTLFSPALAAAANYTHNDGLLPTY